MTKAVVDLGDHPKPAIEDHLKTGQRTNGPRTFDCGARLTLRRVNVLNEEKKQQVLALARMGWSLRRIQRATHIRRETAAAYLKAVGIAIRAPGGWGRGEPAKPAIEVTTDFGAGSADQNAVPPERRPGRPSASASQPYRELIESGLRQPRTGE